MCIVKSKEKVVTVVITVMSLALIEEIQFTATAAWKVEGTTVIISL